MRAAALGVPEHRPPWLLVPLVLAAHLWLAGSLPLDRLGPGAGDRSMARIEVAYVRDLLPAAPPRVAPAPPPTPPRVAAAPRDAASAPAHEARLEPIEPLAPASGRREPALEPAPLVVPAEPAPPDVAAAPLPAPSATLPPPLPDATTFAWPPSTRLSYRLTGQYRGPVEGQAQVEWIALGTRYQVHLEVSVGPPFAPLVARRLSSDGAITRYGLAPRVYEEETRIALREPRRVVIEFDAERVRLPGGREFGRPEGVQDSASQFVQLTWMFTTRPELLAGGSTIELPLALPRRVEPWTYDVIGTVSLDTPVGPVEAVHVKPRREARRGGDLTAEFWVAPSLQYLPVRIVIRQDEETHVDLVLERLPRQAQR